MPNWVEGNIRIRGKASDIISFIKENMVYALLDEIYAPIIEYDDRCKELYVRKPDECKYEELWFEGASRNYVTGYIYSYFANNDFGVLIMDNFHAAWSINPEIYMEWSKKYGIDFRIYGFEQGMQFGQDIVIENGELTKNETMEYNDWDWECPHPNWGG